MLSWLIENTLIAGALAVLLLASSRWLEKRPAVGNFGWLLVIVLLVLPPMPSVLSPQVRRTVTAPVAWVGSFFETAERPNARSPQPRSAWSEPDQPKPSWSERKDTPSESTKADGPSGRPASSKPTKASRGTGSDRDSARAPGQDTESPASESVMRWSDGGTLAMAEPLPADNRRPDRGVTESATGSPTGVSVAAANEHEGEIQTATPPLGWPGDEMVAGDTAAALSPAGTGAGEFLERDENLVSPVVAKTGPTKQAASEPDPRLADGPTVAPAKAPSSKAFSAQRALAFAGGLGVIAWLIGLVVVGVRQGMRVRSMRLLERVAARDEALERRVRAVAERMGVRPPRAILSDRVSGPMVWSLGRSVLVWPAGTPVGAKGTDGMIAHELAHLRRGDHWAAWLELAALTLFWWHPLVWLAHRRAREFAELACDAWVSWALPSDRRAYAEALVSAASKRKELESRGGRGGPALAFGVVESSRDDFKRRLTMVMTGRGSRRLPPAIAAAGLGLVMMLAPSVAGEFTTAQPDAVQIEGLDLIDEVFHPALKRMALVEQAERFERADQYEKAAESYRAAIKLGAEAHDDLAMLCYNSERWEDGQEAFVDAFENDGDSDSLYNAACCAALAGNESDAVKLLRRAVAAGYSDGNHLMRDSDLESIHDRDDVQELADLADAIEELEDLADEAEGEGAWSEAARAYGKLAELVSEEESYLHNAAYASIYAGEYDAARGWLERQIEAGQSESTGMYNMACVEALDGNESRAMRWLERAVEAGFSQHQTMREDSDLDSIRDRDGFDDLVRAASRPERLRREMELEADFGEWDAVIAKAEALLELRDDEDDWGAMQARQMLAKAHGRRGDHRQAVELLLESAQSGNNTHGTMMAIARNYAEAGETRKGAAYLAAVIETGGHHDGDSSFFGGNFSVNVGGGVYVLGADSHDKESDAMKALYGHKLVKAALKRQQDRDELAQFDANSWSELESGARADLAENAEDAGAFLRLGWSLLRQMRLDSAIDAFEGLGEHGSEQLAAYNIACCHAVGGDADEAFEYLNKAVEFGFTDFDQYVSDPDLESLHDDSRWESLMGDLKAAHKADAKKHDHDLWEKADAKEHDHDGWEDADADWDWDEEDDVDWDADDLDEI